MLYVCLKEKGGPEMNKRILVIILLISTLLVVGCSQTTAIPDTPSRNPAEQNQNSATEDPVITQQHNNEADEEVLPKLEKIGNILSRPEFYDGYELILEGKIVSECGSGCWFTLNDGTGIIYVDLAPSNLVIPQKRGSFARVYGKVTKKGSDTFLIGTKVEF
jgi:uncharacterized protein YdeI (BOF family)